MEQIRRGNQNPTVSRVLPYLETDGEEAVDLYNKTGRTAQEWQAQLLYDILGKNGDGLWTHTKFGWSVPRRNGKSEVLIARCQHGLRKGERILYTAHRTTTSHAQWEKLCDLLAQSGFKEGEDYRTIKQFGLERIEMLKTKGKINFRTRSSKGGLGEGYDLLIIDEAQEYTDDQESALKYVVTDSRNPQTLMCGTPPTPVSSGTVFTKYRKDTVSGKRDNAGWVEWSVDRQSDPHDKELWYQTNPSLGTIFTERSINDEISDDDIDFNIQRLGLWIRYNQKSAISKTEWMALAVEKLPKLEKDRYIGIKFGHTGENAAMSIASKTLDGSIFVECIDCRSVRDGIEWMIPFLKNKNVKEVVVDGANGQQMLIDLMKANKLKAPTLPKVLEIVAASSMFESAIYAASICHRAQPALVNVISNCEHRAIGSNGGFGYNSILIGADIALLDSIVLAHWKCATAKEKKVQKIYY